MMRVHHRLSSHADREFLFRGKTSVLVLDGQLDMGQMRVYSYFFVVTDVRDCSKF